MAPPVGTMHILVVDDEAPLRRSLKLALELERYTVALADDAVQALEHLQHGPFDAIVLDVAMPGIDGLELTRRLRADGDRTPILMLTARGDVDDRVAGLDAGADDYLAKPFVLKELHARLRALLRRSEIPAEELRFGDLRMDPRTRDVWRGERRFQLSRTEYSLLELFLRHPRQVLARGAIFETVWGYDFGATSNSLGVYIGYLRRKLEAGGEPRLLHTVHGVGYILRDDLP
ncbi:MAG TPA: response regulator transcription factor [Baekduia sp.]|nr:response regulator transcription factor [Baekduia sp.]